MICALPDGSPVTSYVPLAPNATELASAAPVAGSVNVPVAETVALAARDCHR
jgi:hypothetical protein